MAIDTADLDQAEAILFGRTPERVSWTALLVALWLVGDQSQRDGLEVSWPGLPEAITTAFARRRQMQERAPLAAEAYADSHGFGRR